MVISVSYTHLDVYKRQATVLWSLTYTTSRYRTRFSLMMEVDAIAKIDLSVDLNYMQPAGFKMLSGIDDDDWQTLVKYAQPVDVYKRQVLCSMLFY